MFKLSGHENDKLLFCRACHGYGLNKKNGGLKMSTHPACMTTHPYTLTIIFSPWVLILLRFTNTKYMKNADLTIFISSHLTVLLCCIVDGVHWDMTAHRRMTNLILSHVALAWKTKPPRHARNVLLMVCTVELYYLMHYIIQP